MSKELVSRDFHPTELMKITASTGLVPKELAPYVKPALEEFRNEMAAELGMPDYAWIDKGDLPSRQNGKVGGGMTKKWLPLLKQCWPGIIKTGGCFLILRKKAHPGVIPAEPFYITCYS